MKNDLHLEAVGSSKVGKSYLKSEKNSVLSHHDGIFGYFCPRTNRLFVNRVYYVTALALIIIPGGEQEFPEHEFISYPCKTKGSKKRTSH